MSMSAPPTVSNASNEAAISAEDLFRLHAPFVARFLFRLGVGPDAIDDAVQEVFLVVHRQGGYRPGAARPTSYLANLALHAASAHRRTQRRRRDRETDAPVEDVAAPASGPVELLETNESLRRLQRLLGRLDPDLRSTLILVGNRGRDVRVHRRRDADPRRDRVLAAAPGTKEVPEGPSIARDRTASA